MKSASAFRIPYSAFILFLLASSALGQTPPSAAPTPAPDITKTLDALNSKFAVASKTGIPALSFIAGEGGLACADVHTSAATGRVYLLGGQVTAWQPAGEEPVIFVSSQSPFAVGKAIRGGVPVCFPWFAGKSEGAVAGVGGPDGPFHGTVRTVEWQVEEIRDLGDAGVSITLSTRSDAASKRSWPGDYELHEQITFGKDLRIELRVKNTGAAPMKYEEALHCYLFVKDARQASVVGLDGVDYLDKVDDKKQKHQSGTIEFPGETDRIYLDTKTTLTLVDEALGRRILVEKTNSRESVIWNPGPTKVVSDLDPKQWMNYVAVEPANLGDHALTANPGETQIMAVLISVSK